MQWFRTHIIQHLLAIALIWGIGLQISSAANQDLRESVLEQWLQWQLNSYGEDLKSELAELGYGDEDILNVIRDAQLPADASDESETDDNRVFRVLIGQWNAWNGQNQGMGKSLIPDQHKPAAIQNSDAAFAASALIFSRYPDPGNKTLAAGTSSEIPVSHQLSPMQSGTAIGAP